MVSSRGLIKLSDAAQRLGYHVETLRVRVRRGQLVASRGPHGTYYVTQASLDSIPLPTRSARRHLDLESLEWSWIYLEQRLENEGVGPDEIRLVDEIMRDPTLNRVLYRLITVQRLRLAGLRSTEIADLLRVSARQVRRLTRRDLHLALQELVRDPWLEERDGPTEQPLPDQDDAADDALERIKDRRHRRNWRASHRVVAEIQLRLAASGFQRHRRAPQPDDAFVVKGRGAAAFKVKNLSRAVIQHLLDGGLSQQQVMAIQGSGIGEDELNELILHGLPPPPEPMPSVPGSSKNSVRR